MARRKANGLLLELLREAGWDQEAWANAINSLFEYRQVAPETVREWIYYGRCPHGDMPHVAVHVLANKLGRPLDARAIWNRSLSTSSRGADAASVMRNRCFDVRGTLQVIDSWERSEPALWSTTIQPWVADWTPLTSQKAISCLDIPPPSDDDFPESLHGADTHSIPPEALDVVEMTITHLRRMDDVVGGSVGNLHFVHQQLMSVGRLVKHCSSRSVDGNRRLLRAHAELCQLAGWMAYDCERHGLAQRYYFTGVYSAHAAHSWELLVSLFRSLSCQAVYCNQEKAAVVFAESAREASTRTSQGTQALAASQVAMAQALSGSEYAFRKAIGEAQDLLSTSKRKNDPSLLYWLNGSSLNALAGYSIARFAENALRKRPLLLEEAVRNLVSIAEDTTFWPRDSLFYSSWHAWCLFAGGETEEAIRVAQRILTRMQEGYKNQRSITQIRRLDAEIRALSPLRHHTVVREFSLRVKEVIAQ